MQEPFDITIGETDYAIFPEGNDTYVVFKDGKEYRHILKDTESQWLTWTLKPHYLCLEKMKRLML